ncbi:MAG: two pore domain potassium channel family protein [Bacteroidales bacterium]|nr:two pore domain potassium channel family protein [Bacteroidales bacterium]
MFNVETGISESAGSPPAFNSFFDALYWSTTTLTTVGYGDIHPVSDFGRVVCMISSLFGIAVIALPSGVITASYLEELRKEKRGEGGGKNGKGVGIFPF